MIERKFVSQKVKEYQIKEFISQSLNKVGLSEVRLVRTPLGEKIIIAASRPGLVVGRSGANISKLTRDIKEKFNLENPQIELDEVPNPSLDANIVAESIASSLERFGSARFKGIGHKAMGDVMNSGAIGVEILISGKIPSSRAKNWRVWKGYLKKCGDIAVMQVRKATVQAKLKTGIIGIKVNIMPPDVRLPDNVKLLSKPVEVVEELPVKKEAVENVPVQKEENPAQEKPVQEKAEPKKTRKKAKRTVKKKIVKKEDK